MVEKKLYLIDATAFCYRAFYALSNLATSTGQKTNAVYGFINILKKILKESNKSLMIDTCEIIQIKNISPELSVSVIKSNDNSFFNNMNDLLN